MKCLMPIADLGRHLQVGDHVVIREDLTAYEDYEMLSGLSMGTARSMEQYRGFTAVITSCRSGGPYRIDLDDAEWKWVDGMFSGVLVEVEDLGDIDTAEDLSMMSLFGGI